MNMFPQNYKLQYTEKLGSLQDYTQHSNLPSHQFLAATVVLIMCRTLVSRSIHCSLAAVQGRTHQSPQFLGKQEAGKS
jgi:hypothetical protein